LKSDNQRPHHSFTSEQRVFEAGKAGVFSDIANASKANDKSTFDLLSPFRLVHRAENKARGKVAPNANAAPQREKKKQLRLQCGEKTWESSANNYQLMSLLSVGGCEDP
jgi:hypothetical protein